MKTATDGSTGSLSTDPVGIVLAGGASSRMGRDKTRLALSGGTLPELAARRLATVCAEVAVADGGRGLLPGLPALADGPGRGPAAGILGAAAAYPGRPLLVLACDLPRVPADLLAELAALGTGPAAADWTVPRGPEGFEPLAALYGPAALAALARRVERGLLALHRLAEEPLTVRVLEGEELTRFGDPQAIFLNLNTPEDWERYVAASASEEPPQASQGQISRRNS
ncbi:MAG TPA: NTP transferase domain-containing protein [Thermoanaerobaculia bacterium]